MKFLSCRKKFMRKIRLIGKFTTWQPEKQTTEIHVFPSISRNKGTLTIKFAQLIGYDTSNIFLEKSYTKFGGKTIPRHFLKKIKIQCISRSLIWSFVKFVFIAGQVKDFQNVLKLCCRPLAFTSYKVFYKNKRSLELISQPYFLHGFWKRTFHLLYSIMWPNVTIWLPLLHEIFCNTWIAIVY